MTRKERIILFLLAGLNFTHILDFMIMMPLGNYLMPYFNISPKQFTFLVSAYAISAAVSGFAAAFIVDKFDRKKILVYSYIGFLLGTIACGFAPSYDLLLASRILAGLFGGIIGAQVLSIIADIFTYERRGVAMGSVMSAFAVASILGVPFSLYLTNIFQQDWHIPFLLVGGLGILLVPLIIKFIPPMDGHISAKRLKDPPLKILSNILQAPDQRSALIFSCLLMMGHFLIIPFINPYMEFNKGFSKDLTPMIYLVGGGASFIAAIYLGRIADKKGKLPVFSISVFLSLFMVLLITRMPAVPFSVVLVFFAAWFVFSTGRAITAQAMISEVVKPEQRGSFMSFNGCVQQLGTGIASVAAGLIVIKDETGKIQRYEWLGYLSILVLLASLILGRYIFRKIDKTEAEIKVERELLQETA
jgi:predicted MFS family arabinose efflux permease